MAACGEGDTGAEVWRGPPPDLRDPRLRVLAWARLAPSRCNSQPWLVDMASATRMVVRCDQGRALPALDPDGRQALIALGAFVELAVLAAPNAGRRAVVALRDDGEAAIDLLPDPAVRSDPLFAALPHRRTTRLAYDLEKPVGLADAAALADAAGPSVGFGCVVEPGAVAALRRLTRTAHERGELLHAAAVEDASWLRLEGAEDAAAEDGIPVRGEEVRWAARLGLLSPARLAEPNSPAARMARLQWANLFAATASFGWLATQADRTADRLDAGRAYQRVDLAAAALGLSIHPVSEALGDIVGLADMRTELERLLGVSPPARVQMLFRLGQAGPQQPTPRRQVRSIVRQI